MTVLCQCLEASYFQSYWVFSSCSHSSNTVSLSYPPTAAFFIQPFQGCLHSWSYSDLIFSFSLRLGSRGIPACTFKSCSSGLRENQVPLLQGDECKLLRGLWKEYYIPYVALWKRRRCCLILRGVLHPAAT